MKCFGCFLKQSVEVWRRGERGGTGKLGGAGVWVFITNYHSKVLCFFFLLHMMNCFAFLFLHKLSALFLFSSFS
jgi:hypothetical protein